MQPWLQSRNLKESISLRLEADVVYANGDRSFQPDNFAEPDSTRHDRGILSPRDSRNNNQYANVHATILNHWQTKVGPAFSPDYSNADACALLPAEHVASAHRCNDTLG